jgi:hypothetical protein
MDAGNTVILMGTSSQPCLPPAKKKGELLGKGWNKKKG